MIDVMSFFIKLMLIAVVLISIMNVMIMAVYERIREIGTIAAIGTLPGKILFMFLVEGFCLGAMGAVAGTCGNYHHPDHQSASITLILACRRDSFSRQIAR
jgi:ABC-type lipoprotein release transport system permease subunit